MDLCADYYLQTCETVFIRHALPKGEMTHRGIPIEPGKIKRVALMTVEGENDDISGVGQTQAAHTLCTGIPEDRKVHYLQPDVGHYGVFNGSRFRAEIAPRIADFVLSSNVKLPRNKNGKAATSANGAARAGNGAAHNGPVEPAPMRPGDSAESVA
jgi:poly(3-hydroxybutyrate) depolymerase